MYIKTCIDNNLKNIQINPSAKKFYIKNIFIFSMEMKIIYLGHIYYMLWINKLITVMYFGV